MDQYLYRQMRLDEEPVEVVLKKSGTSIKIARPDRLWEEVAVWRKAYVIHDWFVRFYLKDLVDKDIEVLNDTEIYLEVEDIKELLEMAKAVRADTSKLSRLFPYSNEGIASRETYVARETSEDEFLAWCMWQLEETERQLTEVIAEHEKRPFESIWYVYEFSN